MDPVAVIFIPGGVIAGALLFGAPAAAIATWRGGGEHGVAFAAAHAVAAANRSPATASVFS